MLPNFLCIGAPRAATTWLYRNMSRHPDVWMPPYKELRYFNNQSTKPLILQAFRKKANRWRLLAKKEFISVRGLKNRQRLKWFLKYFLLPRSDKWYGSLFNQAKGLTTGDITPTYSILNENRVAKIQRLMPSLKIIYIIRNPIQRIWSEISQNLELSRKIITNLQKDLENPSDEGILGSIPNFSFRGSEYLKNLEIWEKYYSDENIFVGFFDQLIENPKSFLIEIYDFLELDSSDQYIPIDVHINPNPGSYETIPHEFARLLANKLNNQIERLHLRISNNYTKNWLDYAKHYL